MLIVSLIQCLPILATTNMFVKQKNGETLRFDVEEVAEVFYNKEYEDSTAVDASDLPLKFTILSDSTAEVAKDFSYCDIESADVPAKVRINGDVYEVIKIADWAFAGFTSLIYVTIPSTIKSIGESAFADCKNLAVVIDNSKEKIIVGNDAFLGCKSVTYTK